MEDKYGNKEQRQNIENINMENINPNISIITLNINAVNVSIKTQRLST